MAISDSRCCLQVPASQIVVSKDFRRYSYERSVVAFLEREQTYRDNFVPLRYDDVALHNYVL